MFKTLNAYTQIECKWKLIQTYCLLRAFAQSNESKMYKLLSSHILMFYLLPRNSDSDTLPDNKEKYNFHKLWKRLKRMPFDQKVPQMTQKIQ